MRMATEVAAGGDVAVLLDEFRAAIEERQPDADVKVFTGGSLGTQRQLQEQIELGTIEAIGTASDIVEMAGEFSIFDLPFLFADNEHAYRAMDGDLGRKLNDVLIERRGIRVLAYGELGFRHITNSKRPIETPDDLAGLKIRTPSNELRIAAFQALGAAPTPIPYSELYSALQVGVVDGQENPLITIDEKSLWEVQKFVSMTYHVFTPAFLLVNETWWQGLGDDDRQVLEEAGRQAADRQRAKLDAQLQELVAKAESNGMSINRPNLDAFKEKTRPLWTTFEEAHGSELIEAVEQVR